MFNRLLTAVVVAVTLIASAPATYAKALKVSRQILVDDSFNSSELKWRDGFGKYEFLWKVIVADGMIEICGVGYYTNIYSASQSKDAMRRAYIEYQGRKIMRDLRYFSRVKSRRKLSKATANCRSTDVRAPNGQFSVNLGWDRGRARF